MKPDTSRRSFLATLLVVPLVKALPNPEPRFESGCAIARAYRSAEMNQFERKYWSDVRSAMLREI
jgi:hypothetical protein